MKTSFVQHERGNVVQYLIVLAVIIIIAAFFFPKEKTKMSDATDQTHTNIDSAFKDINDPSAGGSGTGVSTKIYESCAAALKENPQASSGEYTLQPPTGGVRKTMCDMTTDGGGWTQVANYVYDQDTTAPQGSDLFPKEAFETNVTYNKGTAPAGWYPQFPAASKGGAFQSKHFYVNNEKFSFQEVRGDVQFTFMWSVDAFNNTASGITDRFSIESQYVDGVSLTYGEPGSRKHLYTFTWNGWTPSLYGIIPNDARKDFMDGHVTNTTSTLNTTFTRKVNQRAAERIEARIMLDQAWGDENIGIQKYVIWVR